MNNRPLLRDLFPQMFAAPAVSTAAAEPMNITLTPLKDEEYRLRLTKAGWKYGIPEEFIDPVFKTIIDSDKFKKWLFYIEDRRGSQAIIAWQNPNEMHRANESYREGYELHQKQIEAQRLADAAAQMILQCQMAAIKLQHHAAAVVMPIFANVINVYSVNGRPTLKSYIEDEKPYHLALNAAAQASMPVQQPSSLSSQQKCYHTAISCSCSFSFSFSTGSNTSASSDHNAIDLSFSDDSDDSFTDTNALLRK